MTTRAAILTAALLAAPAAPAEQIEFIPAAAGAIIGNAVCAGPKVSEGEISAWIYLGSMQQEISVASGVEAVRLIVEQLKPGLTPEGIARFCRAYRG